MRKRLVSVFTGNSNSGRRCIDHLVKQFSDLVNVRGVFRTEDKAALFRNNYPSIDIVVGPDASRPETLAPAFRHAHAAFIVVPCDSKASFDNDSFLAETMINHAVANGVKYIVLVTSFTVNHMDKFGYIGRRFQSAELLLQRLGEQGIIQWTVLRGGVFMENLLPQERSKLS
jgi:uncharacterized protein YbjT (DUF2867 family)